jgi:spermidine/putrescine transport system permease protein
MSSVAATSTTSRRRVGTRVWALVKRHALTVYALLVVAYLMLPIAVVILFSFNKPAGRFNYVWEEFTFDNWANWNAVLGIQDAIVTSLKVGLLATVVATALGTLIAMAIVRHRFTGRGTTNLLVFLPMSTPEIVLGASLLTLFLNSTAVLQLGFWTIFIAHVMFIVSFVVVTVKARLIGFDRHLEEAAMDLGANELTTFRKVTLPLLAPAMLAASLLGFALSLDDFVITYFTAGGEQTFPVFVWGIARVSVPPQVNVVASAIFLIAIAFALGNALWQIRAARRQRRATA